METLKILMATMEYPPYPLGGTGRFAVNLIEDFKKKHEVTVLTNWVKDSESKLSEEEGNVVIKRLKLDSVSFLHKSASQKQNRTVVDQRIIFGLAVRKYLKKAELKQYDILHNIDVNSASFIDYKTLNKNIKTIATLHDYYTLTASWNPSKFPYKSSDFIYRYPHHNITKYFNVRTIRNSSKLTSNSNYVKNIAVKEAKIPEEKVSVIHHGIDYKKFNVKPAKDKYTNHTVLFIGGNMERKGAKDVIMSAPQTLKYYPDTKYIMVGDAPKKYMTEIKSFIKTHNAEDNFQFVKRIPETDLVPSYQKANVFIMPSMVEALGLVYMEAMTTKTPVIGPNVGGVPEVVTEDTGFLVSPKNPEEIHKAIKAIFDNPEKSKEMGKKGNERVKNCFRKELMSKKMLEVYKETINS